YEKIFLGNGSDEAIDLLIRAFCEPGIDNIISIKPTYGMYRVLADVNNVEYRDVLLTKDLQIDKKALLKVADLNSTLLFLCSPNNPTSNSFYHEDIVYLLENFDGLVVLDEAYIDFSRERSFLDSLDSYPNLVILQTFSKAWGMAAIRLGMAFASRQIITILNKIKYPYNISKLTQNHALQKISEKKDKDSWVEMILEQRDALNIELKKLDIVKEILPCDANFLMVKFEDPKGVLSFLMNRRIILRDRSNVPLCEGCLRITIGTEEENKMLISTLKEFKP
ncbi:MAG: histidinol-phosphate transaminase, partial [Bacteroidales bacterium]